MKHGYNLVIVVAILGSIIALLALVGIDPFPETKHNGNLVSSGKDAIKEVTQFGKDFAANAKNNVSGKESNKKGMFFLDIPNETNEIATYTVWDQMRVLNPGEEFTICIPPEADGRYPEVLIATRFHTSNKTRQVLYDPNTGIARPVS